MEDKKILEVKNLFKYFPYERSFFGKLKSEVKAVDDISFFLKEGESLAIVGESGCGKSTLAKTIIGLHDKNSGEIIIDGKNLDNLNKEEVKKLKPFIQMIFQDPYSALNPTMKVKDIIGEAMLYHNIANKNNIDEKIKSLLQMCGLDESILNRYPSEFSGGQRQRIGIARAIGLNPRIIIADEPVSALDVSMQAQVINLMIKLQRELKMSYIFISHDLNLVKYISNRVAVMYLGNVVEIGNKKDIYMNYKHPYTRALMDAIPVSNPKLRKKRDLVEGDVPSPINPPSGCKFHTRCKLAKDICKSKIPEFREIEDSHFVACHLV